MKETEEQYTISNEDGTLIIRTPTFSEFEKAFIDAFEFDNREFDLSTFSESLVPICFVSGDRLFEDEENLYFISEQMQSIFLEKHFIPIDHRIVMLEVDGVQTEVIQFEYDNKMAFATMPNFKTIKYLKNEALKKNKLIEVCKMIFANSLIKQKSSDEFILNPQLLLVCGMSMLQYVKTKEFNLKKN